MLRVQVPLAPRDVLSATSVFPLREPLTESPVPLFKQFYKGWIWFEEQFVPHRRKSRDRMALLLPRLTVLLSTPAGFARLDRAVSEIPNERSFAISAASPSIRSMPQKSLSV